VRHGQEEIRRCFKVNRKRQGELCGAWWWVGERWRKGRMVKSVWRNFTLA
jgi:hypothetical protein